MYQPKRILYDCTEFFGYIFNQYHESVYHALTKVLVLVPPFHVYFHFSQKNEKVVIQIKCTYTK